MSAYCSFCDADTAPAPGGECGKCGNRTARPLDMTKQRLFAEIIGQDEVHPSVVASMAGMSSRAVARELERLGWACVCHDHYRRPRR